MQIMKLTPSTLSNKIFQITWESHETIFVFSLLFN